MIRENEMSISVIRDSLFFPSVNRARDPPVRPSYFAGVCFKRGVVKQFQRQMVIWAILIT